MGWEDSMQPTGHTLSAPDVSEIETYMISLCMFCPQRWCSNTLNNKHLWKANKQDIKGVPSPIRHLQLSMILQTHKAR